MKALSLWQPHVAAIAAGLKPFETRDWPTRYRGPLALQASSRKWADAGPWHIEAVRRLRRKLFPALAEQLADAASYTLLANHMHYGCVVCVADLVDCVPTSQLRGRIGEAEFWGDFSEGDTGRGRYAFRLDNVRVLDAPKLVVGKQGFFDVDLELGPGYAARSMMGNLFGADAE
jgi:hypothetical protein